MTAKELIKIFETMLSEKWGYILGASGEMWTSEKAATKGGKKWVGHRVADCSGAFVYAFKQYGINVYHGSNRLARVYTESLLDISQAKDGMIAFKGKIKGQEGYSLPNEYKSGGKYYNGDTTDYYHCGLIVGNKVINLQSTSTGCVESKLSENWCKCGYLYDVVYFNSITNGKIEIPYELAKSLYEVLRSEFN